MISYGEYTKLNRYILICHHHHSHRRHSSVVAAEKMKRCKACKACILYVSFYHNIFQSSITHRICSGVKLSELFAARFMFNKRNVNGMATEGQCKICFAQAIETMGQTWLYTK